MPSRAQKLAAAAALVVVTATIEATQVDISPRITARIVERTVREGQPVERGQLLVRLDDQQLTAELRRAEAAARPPGRDPSVHGDRGERPRYTVGPRDMRAITCRKVTRAHSG